MAETALESVIINAGVGGPKVGVDLVPDGTGTPGAKVSVQVVKLLVGDDGVNEGVVGGSKRLPVEIGPAVLPPGAATETTLGALKARADLLASETTLDALKTRADLLASETTLAVVRADLDALLAKQNQGARVDRRFDIGAAFIYVGCAPLGSAVGSPVWSIKRITLPVSVGVEQWSSTTEAWNNRVAAAYT